MRAKVTCVLDGDRIVYSDELVIDDAEGVYRFTCPECGTSNEKPLTDTIRRLLRRAGVRTVEELVESATIALRSDEAIWDALELPAR